MFIELLLVGFALAKRVAELREMTSGEMECPLCRQTLRFSISPSNGHMAAKCETLKWLTFPAGWDDRDVFGGTKNNPRRPCTPAALGSGPQGETCGTCRFRERLSGGAKTYQKCGKMKHRWTHGPGSDIKAAWLACREWEPTA